MRGAAPRLYQSARDRLALDIANGGLVEGQRLSETGWLSISASVARPRAGTCRTCSAGPARKGAGSPWLCGGSIGGRERLK